MNATFAVGTLVLLLGTILLWFIPIEAAVWIFIAAFVLCTRGTLLHARDAGERPSALTKIGMVIVIGGVSLFAIWVGVSRCL